MSWWAFILDLTLRGSIFVAIVAALDFAAGRWLAARHRRLAWLLVPIAFLLPLWVRLPVLPATVFANSQNPIALLSAQFPLVPGGALSATPARFIEPLVFLWALGFGVGLVVVAGRTFKASRYWNGSRFSTDSDLLEIMEDCRILAGVRTPVGVIVSERVASPALLGWLRPKLLLPRSWRETCPKAQLRDVLLHELAHLRSGDLAWNWGVTAMRLVHWFNPLAHFTAWRWHVAQEDAADEFVLRSRPVTVASYDETLLAFLRPGRNAHSFGALGISENFLNLKHRIHMIQSHPRRVVPTVLVGLLLAILASAIFLRPVRAEASEADSKAAAVAAMETWLKVVDAGDYAKSWTDASEAFQKAISSDQWVAALQQVRTPLGECKKRELASVMLQNEVPRPGGKSLKGEFAIAQFKTSFASLFSAIETVTFERGSDGTWTASGYYIKPSA